MSTRYVAICVALSAMIAAWKVRVVAQTTFGRVLWHRIGNEPDSDHVHGAEFMQAHVAATYKLICQYRCKKCGKHFEMLRRMQGADRD